jgi:large subunit ribosomal protein L29
MKRKDIQELKLRSEAELLRLVHDAGERLRALRFDLAAGKVKDISEIREVKKSIARMKTFIKEKITN